MWFAASLSCQELRPVRMHARDGAHLAFGVKARVNKMPSFATRSKCGVFTQRVP